MCNGYYGPNFGEPVCLTCHAFLFPDYAATCPASFINSEKTDDSDSGNDEPSDLNYSDKRLNISQNNIPLWLLDRVIIFVSFEITSRDCFLFLYFH